MSNLGTKLQAGNQRGRFWSVSVRASERTETDMSPRYRWAILFVTWMAFLLSYVDRVAWSSVAAPVGESMGIPLSLLGVFVTSFYISYVFANVTGGMLTDTIGSRLTLTYALVPLGIATFCFGYVHSLYMGIVLQVFMGLAAGADYAAGMKLLASWFDKERGLAMGLYGTATSLAVVISNAAVPRISAVYGWQSAFHLLGIVTFCWAIVCVLVVRDTPPKTRQQSITRREILNIFKNRDLILIAVSGAGGFWATVGFAAWGNSLMTKQYGISPVVAGSILATFGLGAIVAKPLLGWLRDLLGQKSRKILPITCLIAFSAMLLVFGQCSTITEFFIVSPLLGAAAFGYTPLLYVLVTEAAGAKATGAASGATNAIWQLGSVGSPIAVGLVFDRAHSFRLALSTLAIGPLLAALVLCFLSDHRRA